MALATRSLRTLRRISTLRQTSPSLSQAIFSPGPSPPPPLQHDPNEKPFFNQYTVTNLMEARVHMGHRTKLWNPNMSPYILGSRNGMHIIDLDKTAALLRRALVAVSLMAEHDCTFLWLGPQDREKNKIVEKQAQKAGAFTIDGSRWIGGTLTNPIKSNQAKRFNYRIPDCVFVVDTNRHKPALKEARLCGIPTIGIADSDCDPTMLTYPIPGNDDGAHAIFLYCSLMKHAILDGRRRGLRLNRPSMQVADSEAESGRIRARSRPRQPRLDTLFRLP